MAAKIVLLDFGEAKLAQIGGTGDSCLQNPWLRACTYLSLIVDMLRVVFK